MKKITLLAGLLLTAVAVNAQDYYTFTKSTSTYADLTGATSMNNGQVWDWDDFGPVASPFPISVFGNTYNDFGFDDDYFYLGDVWNNFDAVFLYPVTTFIMDRNFSFSGASQSPISYKVEGTVGSRILKLEIKNAGLEMEEMISTTSTLYLNYQIWFYEVDNSIEYHYGDHNITDLSMLNDEAYSTVILAYMTDTNFQGGYIDGTIANPTYTESNDPDDEPVGLDAVPAPNTVYRFEVNPLSIKDQEKIEFAMFPNPANDILNLTFPETVNKPYSVYDLMGREVLKGSVNNTTQTQINVSTLQKGSYILRIAGSTQKFIKN